MTVIDVEKSGGAPTTSRKISEDPFCGSYGGDIIEPPYNLLFLSTLPENSNILAQCIEAMETNIDGFGFSLEPAEGIKPDENGEYPPHAVEERKKILDFFAFCNPDIPYNHLCRRMRRDRETTGNGYWEILRNNKGEISGIEHLESYTMRISLMDKEFTEYPAVGFAFDEANRPDTFRKRFRRYVQIRNGAKVYFKELGDPRLIDSRTGKIVPQDEDTGTPLNGNGCIPATEVLHFPIHNATSVYGIPRWIGALLSILGSRQAEEVNSEYFDNNTVPPLALLTTGKLGKETVKRIEDFASENLKGKKSWGKMLIVEAAPSGLQISGMPQARPEIHFEHLADAQIKDGLFGEYDKANRDKVRSAFRLPPLYVGQSDDYNRATARESKLVAEEQVFGPERDYMDFFINNKILPALGVKYWRYKTLAPTADDAESLTAMLATFAQYGMTVRECRDLMGEILHKNLQSKEEAGNQEWLDLPLSIYLAGLQRAPADENETETTGDAEDIKKDSGERLLTSLWDIRKALEEDNGGCGHQEHDAS
ncbi:MAG: phage portal protein [Synergistaceae bacterium]|nr:phage portal protein [Synergistaceae bacterium]